MPPACAVQALINPLLVAGVFAVSIGVAYMCGSAAGQWTWLLAAVAGPLANRLSRVVTRPFALTRAAKQVRNKP